MGRAAAWSSANSPMAPRWRRVAVSCVVVIAHLIIAPYAIAPFYRFIDPVSTPMLWRWATGARVERITVPLAHMSPALWLNLVLPKRRILEIYLNIVELGPNGEFGAEAGSRFAFGKSAHDLNGREAAELAAILPNPYRRSA